MNTIPNTQAQLILYLTIRIIEAKLETNVARLGKMSPYAEITCGDQIWKSQPATGQHLTPR